MKNKFTFIFILAFSILIFSIFFKGLFQSEIYTPNNLTSEKFLNFKAKNFFTDEEILLAQEFKSVDFTIINIWASWCQPCRIEHKYLMKLSKFDNSNLIGINYKDNKKNASKFLNELGNPYEIILKDPKGIHSIELGAYGIPETFIINNKTKKIVKKYIGPIDEINLTEIIQTIK
tara:strand:+ start:1306 stop:1830 length:525 start_codon:yes stop_codon:yes gene_type:complete